MKKLICILVLGLITGCGSKIKDAQKSIDLNDFKQKISLAMGADVGANFQNVPDEIAALLDKESIDKGFYDYLKEDKSLDSCEMILRHALAAPKTIDTSKYSIQQVSYSYGALFGQMIRNSLLAKDAVDKVDYEIINQGFKNALYGTDTLIDRQERKKMIIDFNNDLNKLAGNNFIDSVKKAHPDAVLNNESVLLANGDAQGNPIDLDKEYQIIFSVTNIAGDTVISTIKVNTKDEDKNSEYINADAQILTDAWREAAKQMKVGEEYTLFAPYNICFGAQGWQSPNPPYNYIVQPYQALIIHSKVIKQQPRYTHVKKMGEKVLEEAKNRPNTVVDKSGYVLTTIRKGDGPEIKPGYDVQAHYILTNAEGRVIQDSHIRSRRMQQPAPSFSLDHVVKGWKLALPKMRVGGHYILVLPYNLAYGEQGNQMIDPYETLTFDLSILQTGPAGSLVKPRPAMGQQFSKADMQRLSKELKRAKSQEKAKNN